MSPRAIDLCWEALVVETAANPDMERGKLNAALKAIRSAAFREGLVEDEAIAEEIRLRAAAYRRVMPQCILTPVALATHWHRVMANGAGTMTAQQVAFQQARSQA